jgi:DNA-binding MarR family transcriptional regulator
MPKIQAKPGPRYQALLQLLRTSEALWNGSRVFFGRWDLSTSQFNILNVLHDVPEGLNQSELSRLLIMHRSNVTGLVDRLESRGLLERKENPEDRRVYRVVLTAKGKKLVGDILPDYYGAAEEIWGRVSPNKAKALAGELETLNENVATFVERVAR